MNQSEDSRGYQESPQIKFQYYRSLSGSNKPWEAIEKEVNEEAIQDISAKNRDRREYKRYLAVMHLEYPEDQRIKYANGLLNRGHSDLGRAILLWQKTRSKHHKS